MAIKEYFIILILFFSNYIYAEEAKIDTKVIDELIKLYDPNFVETFNNKGVLNKKWIISQAKKEGVQGDLALYDGDWAIEAANKHALEGDFGLTFNKRAKHRAISAYLKRDFTFETDRFILQYEVQFQEGQECGGGYIKLITGKHNEIDLTKFQDKTPYSIMFGPDKCGSTNKIHFIFNHRNPINGTLDEKHAKPLTTRIDEIFNDGKPHLFTLVLEANDNTFKIYLDHKVVNEGSLLKDFEPPVNPPAEIDDPNDVKPSDWDDREKIPDPTATKPEDWDETQPQRIPDMSATKPENWLDNEPVYIKDPSAEKPEDWDIEMDGEWEAQLVPNPACEEAAGCGEWERPTVPNPLYKGKWSPPLIENPQYKGKWAPRKIKNKDFFEDLSPYKMQPIVAVGFELWSMSSSILFDNILITESIDAAREFARVTYDVKIANIEKSSDTFLGEFVKFTNSYPWLWAVYTIVILIIVIMCCYLCFCSSKDNYDHKKTDEPTIDDTVVDENVGQYTTATTEDNSNDNFELIGDESPNVQPPCLDETLSNVGDITLDNPEQSEASGKHKFVSPSHTSGVSDETASFISSESPSSGETSNLSLSSAHVSKSPDVSSISDSQSDTIALTTEEENFDETSSEVAKDDNKLATSFSEAEKKQLTREQEEKK